MAYKNKFDTQKKIKALTGTYVTLIANNADAGEVNRIGIQIDALKKQLADLKEEESRKREEEKALRLESAVDYAKRATASIREMDPVKLEGKFPGVFDKIARAISVVQEFAIGDSGDFGEITTRNTAMSKRVVLTYDVSFLNKRLSVITFSHQSISHASLSEFLVSVTLKRATAEKFNRVGQGGWDMPVEYRPDIIIYDIFECFEKLFSESNKKVS